METTCSACNGEGEGCTVCGGSGVTTLCWYTAQERRQTIAIDKLSDVLDRCNDILDKCNDIFEQVSGP